MNPSPKKPTKLSYWLDTIQQESWQMELLISGFSLYGCIALMQALDDYGDAMMVSANSATYFVPVMLLTGGVFAVYIFTINLVINLLVRSIWIGTIAFIIGYSSPALVTGRSLELASSRHPVYRRLGGLVQ